MKVLCTWATTSLWRSHGWQYRSTKFRENMSMWTALSLYLLAQDTLFNIITRPYFDMKNYVVLWSDFGSHTKNVWRHVLPINLPNVFTIICLVCFLSTVPPPSPLPILLSTFQSSSPHTDNGAISSHLPCIFLSLSVLLIVKEYRSEFVTVRGLRPSRQGILWHEAFGLWLPHVLTVDGRIGCDSRKVDAVFRRDFLPA